VTEAADDHPQIEVVPPTPEHRDGLCELFSRVTNGCYCGWWHHQGDDYEWQARCNLEPELNREAFVTDLEGGGPRASGMVASLEGVVVGWLKLAPATDMGKLYGRRVYRTLRCFEGERARVYVVGCIVVHPDHRRRGVAHALLNGAIEWARQRGAEAIEATPRRAREALRDDELWMGPPAIFDRAGFRRIDDGPDPYPVLRLELSDDVDREGA
jgi:GNAT superfamily N-acetyltransferase